MMHRLILMIHDLCNIHAKITYEIMHPRCMYLWLSITDIYRPKRHLVVVMIEIFSTLVLC